jgi:hypothetical protein
VLVGVVGDDLASFAEDGNDLLEELVAGVGDQAKRVARIVALLADVNDAVDGELVGAESECLIHTVADADIVAVCTLGDEVAVAALLHVDRDYVESGLLKFGSVIVAVQHAINDVLGVEVGLVDIRQYCDPWALVWC